LSLTSNKGKQNNNSGDYFLFDNRNISLAYWLHAIELETSCFLFIFIH
jgi:hypothetical protein